VSSGTAFSKRGLGAVLVALIVALAAMLAVSFASAGSAKPAAATQVRATTQSVDNSDYAPYRENGHGALP
jgi:hypothetical protein